VNWAFTHHIGAGQAPASMRTGNLTIAFVKGNAEAIAALIENEIKRRGGTATVSSKAITKAAKAVPVSKAQAKALQSALVNLGRKVVSAQLKAIKVDGAIGAKTVSAVNWAFTHHLGAGQAPAKFRTGNLSLVDVKANVDTLANLIDTETRRRGGSTGAVVTTRKKAAKKKVPASKSVLVKTKDGKTVKATKVATASGETFEVEDPETGKKYYTADPTVPPPPPVPAGVPKATEEQEDEAAEASAEAASQGSRAVTVPETFEPGGGGFLSDYKWPIIGGVGALALIVTGALVLKRRPASTPGGYRPRTTPQRRR
jgi:hypothetical protein